MNWNILTGENVLLGAVDREKDAEVESIWSHDPAYMRLLSSGLARPFSISQMKQRYENIEKQMSEKGDSIYFAVRARSDNRLVGFLYYDWIGWSMGLGMLLVAIGAPERGKGYGRETLRLAVNYAFNEINLQKLAAWVPDANVRAVRFLERAGFQEEARRREASIWEGHRTDELVFGLKREDWLVKQQEEK
jgi:RimJ/RimL family protein N-acetyltransferase